MAKNYFWSGKSIDRANQWLKAIEESENLGVLINHGQIDQIHALLSQKPPIDAASKAKTDTLITDVILHFIKSLQQGSTRFDHDQISINRDSLYISQLLKPGFMNSVSTSISSLDCKDHDYTIYKKFLKDSLTITDTVKRAIIIVAMNYRRYLSLNHTSEFVLINIPEAEAWYFKNNALALKMRTVVGKKTTQTPTIASYIPSITTFPYWNVPRDIAIKEILPKIQKNENYLEQNNFDVVDANSTVVDDDGLNWNDFNEKDFPYYFRQATGSDNALGVVKFNLENPFSIFLHGTSNQKTFANEYRFLSHGCIRLENPFDLANALLRGKLDIEELKEGKKDQVQSVKPLPDKIPTFIIYMPVRIDGKTVTFLNDVYGLIKER